MLVSLIYVIAFLILVALLFWVIRTLALPEPINKVLTVAVVVLIVVSLVIYIVQWASAGAPLPHLAR